jgi:hypothetical protein
MAFGWEDELRVAGQSFNKWRRLRQRDFQHSLGELESRGRQVVNDAIRTGQDIKAQTTAELVNLGRAAAQGLHPTTSPRQTSGTAGPRRGTVPRPTPQAPPTKSTILDQKFRQAKAANDEAARAAVSGAVDEFSFGGADHLSAGFQALIHPDDEGVVRRYERELTEERLKDAEDAKRHGVARNVGRAVGFTASVAAMGGAPGLLARGLAVAPRTARLAALVAKLPKVTGVDSRGLATLAAGGGSTAAIVGQGIDDAVSGHLSPARNYLATAFGGGLGGLATLAQGPIRGGAVEGLVTTIGQDVLGGRKPSLEGALEAARASALTAGAAGELGRHVSAALPRRLKGDLGEAMTRAKVLASGRMPRPKEAVRLPNGRAAIPDVPVGDEFIEAKFGPTARLSTNQTHLQRLLPDRFFVDRWQFEDAGKAAAAAGAPLGAWLLPEETRSPALRTTPDSLARNTAMRR